MRRNRKARSDVRYVLSKNLKRMRHARGYTRRQLARLCGLSTGYVGSVERGTLHIDLSSLEKLAAALGCTEADLVAAPPRTCR